MKSDMTKTKVTNVIAITLLAVVAGVSAGVVRPTSEYNWIRPVQAQSTLSNSANQNTSPEATANDGLSVASGATATTTSVSVDGTTTHASSVHTNLTVGFPMEVAVANGAVRVLIPTATDGAKAVSGAAQENSFVLPSTYLAANKRIDQAKVASMLTCPGNGSAVGGATFSPLSVKSVLYDVQTGKYYDDVPLNENTVNGEAVTAGKFVRYLAYTCTYSGTPVRGGASTNNDTENDYKIVVKDLINPKATKVDTTLVEAIETPGRVQVFNEQSDASKLTSMVSDIDVLISTVMQDVVVKARVDYSLTFRVDGVNVGDGVACANQPTVSTQPLKIDYGAASIGIPVDAAQRLFVNSSVAGGYKITMTQNRNMRRQDTYNDLRDTGNYSTLCYDDSVLDNTTTPPTINRDCIPNFGWSSGLTAANSKAWTNTSGSNTGLGYTVAVNSHGTAMAGMGNTPTVNAMFATEGASGAGSEGVTGGVYYTRLATRDSAAGVGTVYNGTTTADEPTVVASSDSIADGDYYDVCYRLVVDGQNNAGVYDNEVTYTITASI